MKNAGRLVIGIAAAVLMSACAPSVKDKKSPLAKNVIDEAKLADLMLSAADPKEAIEFFIRALKKEPNRIDYKRGLAISLTRAKRYPEAARIYQEIIALGKAEPADKMEYALIAARTGKWKEVRTLVGSLPAGLNTYKRFMVEAILLDHDKKWKAADVAYARAEKLSTNPAVVLNNWGVSQMSRGDLKNAMATFERALSFNSKLFSAKNNLAIARGLRGDFSLPIVPMTDVEKAIILHNLGVIAVRRGKKKIAMGLFAAAVDAHPQHYDAAASKLAALQTAVAK